MHDDTVRAAGEERTKGVVPPLLPQGLAHHNGGNEALENGAEDVHRRVFEKIDALVFWSEPPVHHRKHPTDCNGKYGSDALHQVVHRHSTMAIAATGPINRRRLVDTSLLPTLFHDAQFDGPRHRIRQDMAPQGMVCRMSCGHLVETQALERQF